MKKQWHKPALAALVVQCLSGCMTVRSVSISQLPESSFRQSVVKTQTSSPIVIGIPFNTDYLDEARADFVGRCKDGAIEGVLSKHEDVNYFIGLVVVQKVSIQGYCVRKVASVSTKKKRKV
jgi:hypothetical protein